MANENTRSVFLTSFLSVFFVLAATDVVLQFIYTDFWAQPVTLQMRLGVAGYEVLILFLLSALLSIPAWLLHKFSFTRSAQLVFLVTMLPVVFILLLGWSFYGHFSRFIGTFAVQMILQDGEQLLKFVGKMPSSVDMRMVAIATLVSIAAVIVVCFNQVLVRSMRSIMSYAGVATLAVALIGSMLWNSPHKVPEMADSVSTKLYQRSRDAEFELLVNRAGPLTELAGSLAKYLISQEESFSIDTARLEQIPVNPVNTPNQSIRKHNVVFVLVESLHPDFLQAFGAPDNVMPTVNGLSENAYILDNLWAQASHSNYADIAAISGQYPLRSMNIHFYPDKPNYPKSLPYDVLRPHGYKVGLFSSQNERWGLMENYLMSASVDAFSHVGSSGSAQVSTYQGINIEELDSGMQSIDFGEFMYQGHGNGIERLDGVTTNEAIGWMSTLEEKDPVFLYLNFQASHAPFNALPKNFERRFMTGKSKEIDKIINGKLVGQPADTVMDAYRDSLYYVDQNVERLVNYMKQTNRHDNTIYVISADTSIRFTGELMGNGGDLWPDVLRVPVVLSLPGKNGRTVISEPLEQIDLMPTVLGYIGTGAHPASQGVDFLSDKNDPERVVYAVAQTPVAHQYSAIYKDWQLRHDFLLDTQTLHYVGIRSNSDPVKPLSDPQVQWLVGKLQEWRLAQIGYYAEPQAHMRFYPPKFSENSWQSGTATLVGESVQD